MNNRYLYERTTTKKKWKRLVVSILLFEISLTLIKISLKQEIWLNIIVIMHKQSKWHEAQPSAPDEANALLLLSNLGRKHILMAGSIAEGPNF